MCREFATLMKINVWFRQGGYLFLARTPAIRANLEKSVATQNACGLATRMLTRPRRGGSCPSSRPTASRRRAQRRRRRRLPVAVRVGVRAGGAEARRRGCHLPRRRRLRDHRLAHRRRPRPPLRARRGRASDDHPHPQRRQRRRRVGPRGRRLSASSSRTSRIATRSAPPSRSSRGSKPLVADLSDASISPSRRAARSSAASATSTCPPASTRGAATPSSASTRAPSSAACPVLGRVKVLRQWAGCYDLTPDANPVCGPVDAVERFYQASASWGTAS